MGGAVLGAIRNEAERRDVETTLRSFGLDRENAADVTGAQAYVFIMQHKYLSPALLRNEEPRQRAALAAMNYERTHPGTLERFLHGDELARQAMYAIIAEAADGPFSIVDYRPSEVDGKLAADSKVARAALKLETGSSWVAHFVAAGFELNEIQNLIALPSDYETFVNLPNSRQLPYQRGPHPTYNADVAIMLAPVSYASYRSPPAVTLTALRAVETYFRGRIVGFQYHDKMF